MFLEGDADIQCKNLPCESLSCADAEDAAWFTESPPALVSDVRCQRSLTGGARSHSDLGHWTRVAAASSELEMKK